MARTSTATLVTAMYGLSDAIVMRPVPGQAGEASNSLADGSRRGGGPSISAENTMPMGRHSLPSS